MRATPDTTPTLFSFRTASTAAEVAPRGMGKPDRDKLFIERLCATLDGMPTLQAAVHDMPQLAAIPINTCYALHGNFGRYWRRRIDLSFEFNEGRSRKDKFDIQLTTLPHELRHGYQDNAGCYTALDDPRLANDLVSQLMIDRHLEADATVFSLAVVYELDRKGRHGAWDWAWEVQRAPVSAYHNAVKNYGENAHWNGRAAYEAFNAYFSRGNAGWLESYDLKICQNFMRNADAQPRVQNMSLPARRYAICEYLQPTAQLPFQSGNHLIRRPEYNPLNCNKLLDFLSPEVWDYIHRASERYALTPPPRL